MIEGIEAALERQRVGASIEKLGSGAESFDTVTGRQFFPYLLRLGFHSSPAVRGDAALAQINDVIEGENRVCGCNGVQQNAEYGLSALSYPTAHV